MHVNPELNEKGMALFFNPTNKTLIQTIKLPLYYTGHTDTVSIKEKEGKRVTYKLARDYTVDVKVEIPANGNTWFVIY